MLFTNFRLELAVKHLSTWIAEQEGNYQNMTQSATAPSVGLPGSHSASWCHVSPRYGMYPAIYMI